MIEGAGWVEMSGNKPTSDKVTLVEYNTTFNGEAADTSKRVAGVKNELDESKYTVESVFIDNGWTPAYYTPESGKAPEFETKPQLTSNGDLNTPDAGNTVTVNYKLGDEWAANDASKIDWYAVSEDFDSTSLETVLKSATLLKTTTAVSTKDFQLPMECAGKFIMAVVTPMTVSGLSGEAAYIVNTERTVSSNWVDPNNEGSIAPGSGINIYLAGDSTVKDYSAAGLYNSGQILSAGSWGEFLQNFFDERYVTVNNYAQGGRSVRSFLNEGKLDTIMKNIKAGDYLFVQFGHNDCANGAAYYLERFVPLYTKDAQPTSLSAGFPTIKPTADMQSATPAAQAGQYGDKYYAWDCGATYKGFIQEYIDRALEKGATPVIVTPVARLYYNGAAIKPHHDANMTDYEPTKAYMTENNAYVTACKELYEENKDKGVLLLDAYALTEQMYVDAYTACGSDANGVAAMDENDKTHSNKTGGVIQAGLIAKTIQDANISVSEYVVQPTKVYGEETSGEYIFTIDKNGVFTAKDKELKTNSYWTKTGQALFDSIGGKVTEPAKEISLDFTAEASYNDYYADKKFTDGVISGVYTNANGQELDASVYESGITYIDGQARYGSKVTKGKPLFSFTAEQAAVYTVTTKGLNSGTFALYGDKDCTKLLASAAVGEDIVYKKTSDEAQTIYFCVSDGTNCYLQTASVSYAIPKTVSLDFKDADVMALYENEGTFTDGKYSGDYTNADGLTFPVTVMQNAIQYYKHTASYGTKMTAGTPLFAITLEDKAMYTFEVSAGTGDGTVALYKDADCTESAVSNSVPGSIVYKKKTAGKETLYFCASASNNFYASEVKVTQAELGEETKIKFTGSVSGIEKDDTNVKLTLKGETENIVIDADDYTSNGTELIVGETYELTAIGDKGVYTGTSVVTDESGKADLLLSRIIMDFPIDIEGNYDDYKAYLGAKGASQKDVTDPYTGLTIHANAIVLVDGYQSQYGAKTNAKDDMFSFDAKQDGTCTVTVYSTVAGTDSLILKVNGKYAPNYVSTIATKTNTGAATALSVMVNKGDKVTLCDPTRNNLYYKSVEVSYTDPAFLTSEAVENGTEVMIYGTIDSNAAKSVNKVGFYYAPGAVKGFDGYDKADSTDEVYTAINYNGTRYAEDGKLVYGTLLTDMDGTAVYVYTFCETTDGEVYSAYAEVK
ncbi:MAG: hypothetical protein IKS17_07950 [Firmicutes bacterium]|nr:hypothetical protein [Bacillota bacterium]